MPQCRHSVGTYQEMTSQQLIWEHPATVVSARWATCALILTYKVELVHLISITKKNNNSNKKKSSGGEWIIEYSPRILAREEKAITITTTTTTTTSRLVGWFWDDIFFKKTKQDRMHIFKGILFSNHTHYKSKQLTYLLPVAFFQLPRMCAESGGQWR